MDSIDNKFLVKPGTYRISLIFFILEEVIKFDFPFPLTMWAWPSTNFTRPISTTSSKSFRLFFYPMMCFDVPESKNQGLPLLLSISREIIVASHKFVFSSLDYFLSSFDSVCIK